MRFLGTRQDGDGNGRRAWGTWTRSYSAREPDGTGRPGINLNSDQPDLPF